MTSEETAVRPRPASPRLVDTPTPRPSGPRRKRGRRSATIAGLVLLLTAAVAVAFVVDRGRPGREGSTQADVSSPVVSFPVPARLVVHTHTATAAPGAIEVVDPATGQVIRTLGAAYDPYLLNGFQLSADRSTLYYTRLNAPAQTIEIVAAPLAGGPSTVIAHGVDPQLSPDGALMSFRPYGEPHTIAIMRLGTGQVVEGKDPAAGTSAAVVSTSWLAGSHQLLVTTATDEGTCDTPVGRTCHLSQPPPPPPAAYLLDVKKTPTWARVPSLTALPGGWNGLSLQGPGPRAGTVLGISNASAGAPTVQTLVTLQVTTGRLLSQLRLPSGTSFLARDTSGTHVLLSDAQGTVVWSPPEPGLRTVGPPAAEAAW